MPWKNGAFGTPYCAFIVAVLEGRTSFSAICREHGVSRPSGYKWFRRFLEGGLEGLREHSRRPHRFGQASASDRRQAVLKLQQEHPTWGSRKIAAVLRQRWPRQRWPHPRTIERWEPKPPRRSRRIPIPALRPPRGKIHRCHDVWTMDFKGWFRTADGARCEPLTVRDAYSCYLLCVRHVPAESEMEVRRVLTQLFRREGLPRVIRVDNGAPFGGTGALGLTRLSVWWLQLGIAVEYSRPGHPEDNGAHEQMHRVLKAETANPPRANLPTQNRRLEQWRREYNSIRPHEKWDQQPPAQHYRRSRRAYPVQLPAWRYSRSQITRRVSRGGWIGWDGRRRLIGRAFGGHTIALVKRHRYYLVQLGTHVLGELHRHDPGGLRPLRYSRTPPLR
ncbi:MAG: integrase core domain-containing protein [Opitutaceae bacterium]